MQNKRFHPDHIKRLDSPERREKLPPERLLKVLPLERSQTVLDLGAGTGYFTIPVSSQVERVLALDVQTEMLEELKKRLQIHGIHNVEVIRGEIEKLPVNDDSVHHVLASLVLHEVESLEKGLNEIHRVLKNNGHFFCLEWGTTEGEEGPPLHHRISENDMEKAMAKTGFDIICRQSPTPNHYLLVGRK